MKQDSIPSLDFNLERETPFSFTCRACGRCCSRKVISVGPHEILGMARLLGIGTSEFLSRYTDCGGTILRFEEDGRCAFVMASGCRVHPRRPLVCRLYPLGRMIDAAGEERFARFPAEPGCEARTGGGDESATIAGFIESQDALPYLEWTRRYSDLYKRMIGILRRAGQTRAAEGIPEGEAQESGNRLGKARDESEEPRSPLSSWQDIDVSLAEYCGARGLDVPEEVEEAIDLHIRAMEEWLDGLEATLPREGEG